MTEQDKKRIAEYMGLVKYPPECMGPTVFYRDEIHGDIRWDLNSASLCVQEMQKRGDWVDFLAHTDILHYFIYRLFNVEDFFNAMSEWLKEGK